MILRFVAFASLAFSAAASAQDNAPFNDLQGMWYDMSNKVAVEIVDRQVIVRELDTQNITINKQGWAVGTVIANYESARHEGETFWFSGQCWGDNGLISTCFDNATHYDRPTAKHWAIHLGPLTLWRRDHFSKADWSGRN